jgi:hypothetical protein
MPNERTIETSSNPEHSTSNAPVRSGFFFWASVLLLSFVLIGFARTFYLRAFFDVRPIPGYLYVHGSVLTAWFVWLFIQTSMVRTGRTATHRRLGIVGVVIGAMVIATGPMATLGQVGRLRDAGLDWNTDLGVALGIPAAEGIPMLQFAAGVVWINFASIVLFTVLLAGAVTLRHNPQTHKRLMLLASIAIIGPALARISRWQVLGGESGPFIPVVILGLLVTVIVHDVVTMRRVHRATLIGCGAIVLVIFASRVIAGSEFGRAVIRTME